VAAVRILVVGGASLDRLDGRKEIVAGGAGMYTAMAAYRSGAEVTQYAPRPEPMPDALREVATRLHWLGPSIAPEDLARFEINHHDGCTTYVEAFFGAEDSLSPAGLPDDLSSFDCVHLVPLGDIRRQRDFLLACRARGANCISVDTALTLMKTPDARAVLQAADIFFMNESEAIHLFGSLAAVHSRPGQLLFVTRGQGGATVVQGDVQTDLAGIAATLLDPTGAGDTFCGATLVGVARALHPVMAARRAMPLAAETTTDVGPAALLKALPRDSKNAYVIQGAVEGQHVIDLQKPWRRIRKAAGLDRVRIHDLRHTYASNAVMQGLSIPMVGKLLGHTQIQTTMRYAHLADDPVREAAALVAGTLDRSFVPPAKPAPAGNVVAFPKRA